MNAELPLVAGIYSAYANATVAGLALRPRVVLALFALFAGWLFLPVEVYPPDTITRASFTVEVIGSTLPGQILLAKAWIVPSSVLRDDPDAWDDEPVTARA